MPITSSWTCEEAEVRASRQQASIRKVDVHTLKVTYSSLDGKVRRENTFVLNANGKSISCPPTAPCRSRPSRDN